MKLEGPVYALGDYSLPLCDVVIYQCPVQTVPATVNPAGTTAAFTVPAEPRHRPLPRPRQPLRRPHHPDHRLARHRRRRPRPSPALPAEDHKYARAIHSGQTITGTFVADGDPDHRLQDVNLYYLPGTAGSHLRVTLERVDTTKTWEHPDTLDPQLEIMAPDGLIPQNLVAYDRQPGLDLNAELHRRRAAPDRASTSSTPAPPRAAAQYRLTYELLQPGDRRPADQRVLPLANAFLTVPVGQTVTPSALALDPRGYRLSGARLHVAATPLADDTGTVDLSAAQALTTNPDGTVEATLTPTGPGKRHLRPASSRTASRPPDTRRPGPGDSGRRAGDSPTRPGERPGAATRHAVRIPRYQPVAAGRIAITDVFGDQSLGVTASPVQKLPVARRPARRTVATTRPHADRPTVGQRTGTGAASLPRPGGWGWHARLSDSQRSTRTTTPSTPPPPSRCPRSRPHAIGHRHRPAARRRPHRLHARRSSSWASSPPAPSCTRRSPPSSPTSPRRSAAAPPTARSASTASAATASRRPSTSQLDLHDATGQTPTYPVLVQLNLAGVAHGKLLLDGGALRCDGIARMWHQRDAQGVLIPDPILRYELGRWARYVGALPDPASPGGVKPVWGTRRAPPPAGPGQAPGQPAVRPLACSPTASTPSPGSRTRLYCREDFGQPCGDTFRFWPGYLDRLRPRTTPTTSSTATGTSSSASPTPPRPSPAAA